MFSQSSLIYELFIRALSILCDRPKICWGSFHDIIITTIILYITLFNTCVWYWACNLVWLCYTAKLSYRTFFLVINPMSHKIMMILPYQTEGYRKSFCLNCSSLPGARCMILQSQCDLGFAPSVSFVSWLVPLITWNNYSKYIHYNMQSCWESYQV